MHEEPANAAINKLRKKALRIERNLDSDTDDETLLDYEKRRVNYINLYNSFNIL
jgi:hypothetical protein